MEPASGYGDRYCKYCGYIGNGPHLSACPTFVEMIEIAEPESRQVRRARERNAKKVKARIYNRARG